MAADTVVLTARIPVALQQQLDAVAQAMERSRAWVITQALEHFVAVQAWQVEEIQRRMPRLMRGILSLQKKLKPSIINTNHDARLASACCKRLPWNSTPNAKNPYTPP